MAYKAQTGMPVTLWHPVRDVDDNYVAAQAAAVTKALLGPDRLAAPTELASVMLTDYVTGWVRVTFTGTRAGTYTLTLTNPASPTADGRATEYPIVVDPGIEASAQLLTSLDRVRTRMQLRNAAGTAIQPGEPHPFDSLIALLVSEVSDEYQHEAGRTIVETSYVEYLDGTGRPSLVLGSGPLASFSLLESVEYRDDGAGGVTEVKTTVPRYSYVLAGLASQPRYCGRGRVDLVGCAVFTRGRRNYRASYAAGWSSIPEGLVGTVTADVVYRLMTRDTGHLLSQALGDGNISYLRPQQMQESRDSALSLYRLEAA